MEPIINPQLEHPLVFTMMPDHIVFMSMGVDSCIAYERQDEFLRSTQNDGYRWEEHLLQHAISAMILFDDGKTKISVNQYRDTSMCIVGEGVWTSDALFLVTMKSLQYGGLRDWFSRQWEKLDALDRMWEVSCGDPDTTGGEGEWMPGGG